MPVTWEIRDSLLIVTVIGHGREEPAAAIMEAMTDPRFKPGTSLLFDMRLSTDNPTSEEARMRVSRMAPLQAKGITSRCAIVIGLEAYQYGLARMIGIHAEIQGWHLEAFTEIDEAIQWLSTADESEPASK